MWRNSETGTLYTGDCRPGDRAATELELAAYNLARAKAAKGQAIAAAYMAAVLQGVPHQGTALQIRDEDRPNIVAVFARAMANLIEVEGVAWPEGGHPFRMLDNSTILFTQAEFIALAVKAADRFTALRMNAGALKDALAAANTLAAVQAIDHTSGWAE